MTIRVGLDGPLRTSPSTGVAGKAGVRTGCSDTGSRLPHVPTGALRPSELIDVAQRLEDAHAGLELGRNTGEECPFAPHPRGVRRRPARLEDLEGARELIGIVPRETEGPASLRLE